ncbi:hypothetical protein K504DRAFT_536251 [Pleomassaria siparia CBS 279.74]|uniref:Dolichyl-diphosphooligosaccharide--protein glycosyltransferase subunit 4 n=1 Tax=Pleomassaria siparia CBS 279.74 TaxID=1314801 RepID=A0A6G1K2V5_9PLEO|nr:hypothetical protein K504DRAFT_536251 [Pleomassaria siparia CBS 279.74]
MSVGCEFWKAARAQGQVGFGKFKVASQGCKRVSHRQHHIPSSNLQPPASILQPFSRKSCTFHPNPTLYSERAVTMISDNQLYSLAIFLGSAAMLLIILYHFLEVNSEDQAPPQKPKAVLNKVKN